MVPRVWMSITVAVKTGLFAIAVEAIPTVMMAIGAANLWENRSLGEPLVVIGSVLMLVARPLPGGLARGTWRPTCCCATGTTTP